MVFTFGFSENVKPLATVPKIIGKTNCVNIKQYARLV